MMLSKARRRQLTLSFIGITFAWTLSVTAGVVLLPDWLPVIIPVTTVIALMVTYLINRRLRTHSRRASITVGDLRGPPRRAVRR